MTDSIYLMGQPVRSLQTMLRELSFYYTAIPRIIPDGIFGQETADSVTAFQRFFRLPVTGTVDNDTWDAVVLAYNGVQRRTGPGMSTAGLPGWRYPAQPGQRCVYLYLIQAMFRALSHVLEGVEEGGLSGSNTPINANNVRWLQRRGGLRETGAMGQEEWNLLARLYSLFILRSTDPELCGKLGVAP